MPGRAAKAAMADEVVLAAWELPMVETEEMAQMGKMDSPARRAVAD